MDARTGSKIVGWSFIGLLTIVLLIVFWQPISRYWVGRAFAAPDVRKLENEFLAGEHLGKDLAELPKLSGRVLIVKPTVWNVYRVGNVFATSITPTQEGKKDNVLSVARIDDHWYGLDDAVRASDPDDVDIIIFVEYTSRKVGNYVPVDGSSGSVAAHRKSARLKFYDARNNKYLGQFTLIGTDPDQFSTNLGKHSGDLPNLVYYINEMAR